MQGLYTFISAVLSVGFDVKIAGSCMFCTLLIVVPIVRLHHCASPLRRSLKSAEHLTNHTITAVLSAKLCFMLPYITFLLYHKQQPAYTALSIDSRCIYLNVLSIVLVGCQTSPALERQTQRLKSRLQSRTGLCTGFCCSHMGGGVCRF